MHPWLLLIAAAGCGFQVAGQPDANRGIADADADAIDAPRADAGPDAPPITDAAPTDAAFSPSLCPASYDRTIVSSPGSVYRFVATDASFAIQHADCADDAPGWTHLIVLDDMAEAMAIGAYNSTSYSYVGAVQLLAQAATNANWYRFDGAAVSTGWSPNDSQPDDGDGVESGTEQRAVVASTGNMHDVTGNTAYAAVCECDGRDIAPTIATTLP